MPPVLISHRQSAYLDNEELERTAGLLEIKAQTAERGRDAYGVAALALRILQRQDLREASDFLVTFERLALDEG